MKKAKEIIYSYSAQLSSQNKTSLFPFKALIENVYIKS